MKRAILSLAIVATSFAGVQAESTVQNFVDGGKSLLKNGIEHGKLLFAKGKKQLKASKNKIAYAKVIGGAALSMIVGSELVIIETLPAGKSSLGTVKYSTTVPHIIVGFALMKSGMDDLKKAK